MNGINAAGLHGAMPNVWRNAVLEAAPDFADMTTGESLPGMEAYGPVFLAHLASVAEMEGDGEREIHLRTTDLRHRREEAAGALAVAHKDRTHEQRGLVRRVAVGLTNLGSAQRKAGQRDARNTLEEAAALAREIGDWRLEALNRLNLGVYWMVVSFPAEFARADAEFAIGYDLAIADDPPLAGDLMTERGTVFYERGMATTDRAVAETYFQQAATHLELAVGLREPNAVLCHQFGQVHRQLGNFDYARAWFEQGIELRENELTPGAGADARLHLAQTLDEANLVAEALSYALSAEAVLARVDEPDPTLQFEVEQTIARLALRAGAMPHVASPTFPH